MVLCPPELSRVISRQAEPDKLTLTAASI